MNNLSPNPTRAQALKSRDGVLVWFAAMSLACGQGITILHSFQAGQGSMPQGRTLVVGEMIYGTASEGGSGRAGTVFKMGIDGSNFTVLHNFDGTTDGANPQGNLLLIGSTLYGTTFGGPNPGNGTVYKVNTDGSGFGTIHSFPALAPNSGLVLTNADGANPQGGMTVLGYNIYGCTLNGGPYGTGTWFRFHPDGSGFTIIPMDGFGNWEGSFGENFGGASSDGDWITVGDIVYGTAELGGWMGAGTILQITNNQLAALHEFDPFDPNATWPLVNQQGGHPSAGLVWDGQMLYGTTCDGGLHAAGTIFKASTNGDLRVLYHFSGSDDGGNVATALAVIGDRVYGVTQNGGTSGFGSVFSIGTDGTGFTTLHQFRLGSGGFHPEGGLVASNGKLYGVTLMGGDYFEGTVFRFDLGSQPVPRPRLSYSLGPDGHLVFSWPATATNFVLQKATGVFENWGDITDSVVLTNGTYQYKPSNPGIYDVPNFYRLRMVP
jgi:uncharacterized repeat protein (TIGR03803 family)